jgi:hypothetical protein
MSTQYASAQIPSGQDAQLNLNALGSNDANGIVRSFDARYRGIAGSPFLSDQWNTGTIMLYNGRVFTNILLKVDLYSSEVMARRQAGDSIIIQANSIGQILLTEASTGKKYTFKKFSSVNTENPTSKDSYVDVMYEGKYTFMAERKKKLIKADYKGAYSAGRPYDEFVNETTYYIQKPDKSLKKLKLNRKAILEVFTTHQDKLKSFSAKENIDFKNEQDIIKLFQFHNSLPD